MKPTLRTSRALAPAWLALFLAAGCTQENYATVTWAKNGAVTQAWRVVIDRQSAETVMTQFEQRQRKIAALPNQQKPVSPPDSPAGEKPEPQKTEPAKSPETAAPGNAAEAEFAARFKKFVETEISQQQGNSIKHVVKNVQPGPETVSIEGEVVFPSLKDFVEHFRQSFESQGFSRIRLSQTPAGKLQIQLYAQPDRFDKDMLDNLNLSEVESHLVESLQFAFPGQVISSTFPERDGHTTGLTVDSRKPQTIDQARAVTAQPVIIVVEPAGLPLDGLPLDSGESAPPATDQPQAQETVIDAPTPYYAKGLALAYESTIRLPDPAQKDAQNSPLQATGECLVRAALIAPENRKILALKSSRVIRAVDDQGRELLSRPRSSQRQTFRSYSNDNEQQYSQTTIELHLSLPEVDANAVEKLEGEAVLSVFSSWQEILIPSLTAAPVPTVDLAEVLPGAKLQILNHEAGKAQPKTRQGDLKLALSGPQAVKDLVITAPVEGAHWQHSFVSDDSTDQQGDTYRRTMQIHYNAFGEDLGGVSLRVRRPVNLHYERIRFTLEALDLP